MAASDIYYVGKGRRRRMVNREEMRRELFRKAGISTKYVKRLPHAKRVDKVALGRGSARLHTCPSPKPEGYKVQYQAAVLNGGARPTRVSRPGAPETGDGASVPGSRGPAKPSG